MPEVSINGQWLANKMEDSIERLADTNFGYRGNVTVIQ